MLESPAQYCCNHQGRMLFHKGIPYIYWIDEFGHNHLVYWSQNTQSGCIAVETEFECLKGAVASIEQHFTQVLCPYCVTTSLECIQDGRYICLRCNRVPQIYLWCWDDDVASNNFALCFNKGYRADVDSNERYRCNLNPLELGNIAS